MENGQILVAKIFLLQWADFDDFLVKNDYSLVIFNYSISHLQPAIRKSQIWLKFSHQNFNILICQFWLFLVKNDYLNSGKRTRWIVRVGKITYFRLRGRTNIGTRKC